MLTHHSPHKNKKHSLLSKKKTLDNVEEKMNHIQASLTTDTGSSLGSSNVRERKLKKELEEKESLASKLEEQLSDGRARQVVDVISEVEEWEEELSKKKKQINKKKEQLKRIQDNGWVEIHRGTNKDNSCIFYFSGTLT